MADHLSINEWLFFVILPNFLEGSAGVSLESAKTAGNSSARPVNAWLSAVNFFLRRYATDENIEEALNEIQALAQRD